jgi:hypothetical protein
MSRDESCNTCYVFQKDDPKKEESHGNCRRYPPQTIVLGELTDDATPVKVKLVHNRTHSTFWCAEWKP